MPPDRLIRYRLGHDEVRYLRTERRWWVMDRADCLAGAGIYPCAGPLRHADQSDRSAQMSVVRPLKE